MKSAMAPNLRLSLAFDKFQRTLGHSLGGHPHSPFCEIERLRNFSFLTNGCFCLLPRPRDVVMLLNFN